MTGMEITPRELRDVEIHEQFRGYSREEVNDLLERAAAALEAATERAQELTERLTAAQSDAGRSRENEDILHRTLLLAQRAADEAVSEAQAKARQMLDDAEISSRKMLAEAEADARRRGEAERRRLEEEIIDLAGRRDSLLGDVEALTRFETDYRERMTRSIEADLATMRTRPAAAPGAVPEPSNVEIPVLPEGISRRRGGPYDQANEPTSGIDVRAMFEAATAREAAARTTGDDADGDGEADDTDDEGDAPAIDLLDDGVDAEVLDDDAFFATLREAVHDEAPLGPREGDDDDDRLFLDDEADDDTERASFRDVFRRRR